MIGDGSAFHKNMRFDGQVSIFLAENEADKLRKLLKGQSYLSVYACRMCDRYIHPVKTKNGWNYFMLRESEKEKYILTERMYLPDNNHKAVSWRSTIIEHEEAMRILECNPGYLELYRERTNYQNFSDYDSQLLIAIDTVSYKDKICSFLECVLLNESLEQIDARKRILAILQQGLKLAKPDEMSVLDFVVKSEGENQIRH